jgi:putative tricarboxylic transport membrane protein
VWIKVRNPASVAVHQEHREKWNVTDQTTDRRWQDGPFADVPTWKEQGVDIVAGNFRPVIGPPKMSLAAVSFWDAVFIKTAAPDQLKADVQKRLWSDVYLDNAGAKKYIDVYSATVLGFL